LGDRLGKREDGRGMPSEAKGRDRRVIDEGKGIKRGREISGEEKGNRGEGKWEV